MYKPSVFLNKQLQCMCTILIILLHLKCKESSAVIKLQVAYTGMSIKSRGKNYSQGFWKGTGKILIVWDVESKKLVWYIWATDFSPTLFCFNVQTFSKFLLDCFSCSCLEKKDNNTICHLTSNQHNPPMRNDEKVTIAQDHKRYDRNPSCSCYKLLTESNRLLNHLWG